MNQISAIPSRIVCLSTESVETLYLLGEQDRIVGITGFAVRPPEARREKPKVSGFSTAKIERILDVKPDLILGFSNLQADMMRDLARAGIEVHIFNQRSIAGIFNMIATLGRLVGATGKAEMLCASLMDRLNEIRARSASLARRPRIYFEEWHDPLICGITWVSELIAIAGGIDVYADIATRSLARDRTIHDPLDVAARAPDLIIGSWCGKKFQPELVVARPGWENVPAVKNGHLYEIQSALILQPGPAALTDGLDELIGIIGRWSN